MAAALRAVAERAHGATGGAAVAVLGDMHEIGGRHAALAVLGDMLELGDHATAAHREIGELARELRVGVVALGELAAAIAECAGGELATSPADAAARALARTRPGDWILLKASRGMRLERVLDALGAAVAAGDPPGAVA
jgi:UDP-N-acetylmuramyl pentapeptide synthase